MAQHKGSIPWNKGKKIWSQEHKDNLARRMTGNRLSAQTKLKISQTMQGRKHGWEKRGSEHHRWIFDRNKLAKRQERNDSAYKEWRKSVRDRDDWKCKMRNDQCDGKVVAHHILPWAKFPELRYQINNGITLCRFHHPRKRDDEMKLSPFFQSLVVSNSN